MEAVGVEDFAAYQAHLEAHPGEFEDLLNTVLINVTSFFRDDEAWEVLRDRVIPQVLANAKDERPSGCGASAAPRARSPIRSPCCSPRPWAWRILPPREDLRHRPGRGGAEGRAPRHLFASRRGSVPPDLSSAISSAPTTTTSSSATCANA
jgi:hypothetical protein